MTAIRRSTAIAAVLAVAALLVAPSAAADHRRETICEPIEDRCDQILETASSAEDDANDVAKRVLNTAMELAPDVPECTVHQDDLKDTVVTCSPVGYVTGLGPPVQTPEGLDPLVDCDKDDDGLHCHVADGGDPPPDPPDLVERSPYRTTSTVHVGQRIVDVASTDGDGTQVGSMSRTDARLRPTTDRAPGFLAVATTLAAAAGIVLLILYRRLSPDELLDNDLRARMVEIARAEPGIHASELARRLDVAVTTVLYHGRLLAEADLLLIKRTDGRVRYLAEGEAETRRERELRIVMNGETKADLIEVLSEEPGLNMSDVGRRLEKARNTIKHHVDDLIDRGLLVDLGEGRSRSLHLHPDVRDTVEDG